MATRSTIALQYADGTIRSVYCHFDGYLDGVGAALLRYWTATEAVEKLIAGGDMSSLAPSLDDTVFYGRDRGESETDAQQYSSLIEYYTELPREEFNYIMRDGVWWVAPGSDPEYVTVRSAIENPQDDE